MEGGTGERRRFARAAELAALGLAAAALAARVAVACGASAGWLSACLTLAASAAVLAVVRGGGRWLDAGRLPLVLLALWQVPDVYPKLGGDGFEYYVLARSLLFDHDLDLANDFEGLSARPVISPLGGVTSRTPIGVGLLWTPGIVLAHAGVRVANAFGAALPADGFSAPYQAAATATTFVCGVLALFLVEALGRRFYPRKIALLVALTLWFATPLEFYSVANPFMSHGGSAFASALFVVLWLAGRESEEPRHWLRLGLAGGLMTLVRVQDGVLLALPALDLVLSRGRRALRPLAGLAVGPALTAALQSIVWSRLWSPDFVRQIGTQGPGFTLELHVRDVLFSPRHGLFTWTPIWAVAVLGFLLWLHRDRRLAAFMMLAFAMAVALNSSMGDWWGSDGFGQRRFLGLTALFALGLGEAVLALRARPLVPVALVFGAFAIWNHQFAIVYNRQMVAGKDEAIPLDRLAAAQVELLSQRLLAWQDRLPAWLFVGAYDNLKGVWIDEGRPSLEGIDVAREKPVLPLLLGQGWRPPEVEDGVRLRSTWGKRSWLQVLVKEPADFRVLVRARSQVPGETVRVALDVNGTSAGEATATASWSELEFRVPRAALRPGLNQLLLVADKTARGRDPLGRARNTALAVQRLRFERTSAAGAIPTGGIPGPGATGAAGVPSERSGENGDDPGS